MTKISLDEFCNLWAPKNDPTKMIRQFEYNVFDFTTDITENTKSGFKKSFDQKGFYGTGNKWKPRTSNWGIKKLHDILKEEGNLRENIKSKNHFERNTNKMIDRKKYVRLKSRHVISTNEFSKRKRKRGKNPYLYAAIHNTDPRFHNFTVNKKSTKKPVQRQFMGLNKTIDAENERFIKTILFRNFPL